MYSLMTHSITRLPTLTVHMLLEQRDHAMASADQHHTLSQTYAGMVLGLIPAAVWAALGWPGWLLLVLTFILLLIAGYHRGKEKDALQTIDSLDADLAGDYDGEDAAEQDGNE